ncbi:homeobox protein ceh-31-like isoform X2 [Bolinopsis microptera]|uniref:homeobox protein ceh-31-like isoform X2 n=1 Tax=Bolinopsis microptera TaxID=2820187 RepID=UPI00307B0466
MSQPHYEYPSRTTWLGYQATKPEHVLTTTTNKMQDSNHVTSYPDWRQNSGDSYFPQCQFSCQFKDIDTKHDLTSAVAPLSPQPSLPDQKPQIGSSTTDNGTMVTDTAKLQEYLIHTSNTVATNGIQPLSPTSTSDHVTSCGSPISDTKDQLMLRTLRSPPRDMMCSSPPSNSRCTAAPASSTVSPHSPVSSSDIAGIGKTKKKRKPRTCFSVGQMLVLENTFQQTKYVSITDRGKLAGSLGLTDSQIKVWFQNRRSKWRKTMDSKDHHGNLRHMSSCTDQQLPPSQQYFWPNAQHHHQEYHVPTTTNPEHLYNGYSYRHMVG